MFDCENLTKKIRRSGVYCIYNINNNRCYIGSANSLWRRFTEHRRHLRNGNHGNAFLQADFNKCDENAFIFFILEECFENRVSVEQKWLSSVYDNKQQCYNIEKVAGSRIDWKPTEETRKRMSESAKNRTRTPWSQEVKNKISESNMGRTGEMSADGKRRMIESKQKTYDVKIISPSGIIYGPIINLQAFCREHQLDGASLLRLIKGKQKRIGKWTLAG